jgi:hypothetical protein
MALSLISGRQLPLPGVCISCGSTGIDMVDTGRNEQLYGAVLICIVCFRDGATRITELNLFPKDVHEDMIEELEEKIEWRHSLEPTVKRLEADIASAVHRARHGFNQRHLTDSAGNEVLESIQTQHVSMDKDNDETGEDGTQILFSIRDLRERGSSTEGTYLEFTEDERQNDDNVGDQRTA